MSDYQSIIQSLAQRTENPFIPDVDQEDINEGKEYGKEILSGAGGLLASESSVKLYKKLKSNEAFKKLGITDEDMETLETAIKNRDFGAVSGQLQSKVAAMTKDGIKKLKNTARQEFSNRVDREVFQKPEITERNNSLLDRLTDKDAYQKSLQEAKERLSSFTSDRLPDLRGARSLEAGRLPDVSVDDARVRGLFESTQKQFDDLQSLRPRTTIDGALNEAADADRAVTSLVSKSFRGPRVGVSLADAYSADAPPLVKDNSQGLLSRFTGRKIDARYQPREAPEISQVVRDLEGDVKNAGTKRIARSFKRTAKQQFNPEEKSDIIKAGQRRLERQRASVLRSLEYESRNQPVKPRPLPKDSTIPFSADDVDDEGERIARRQQLDRAKFGDDYYELPKPTRIAPRQPELDLTTNKPSGMTETANRLRIKAEQNRKTTSDAVEARGEPNVATTEPAVADSQIIEGTYSRGGLKISSRAKKPSARRQKAIDEGTQAEQPQVQRPAPSAVKSREQVRQERAQQLQQQAEEDARVEAEKDAANQKAIDDARAARKAKLDADAGQPSTQETQQVKENVTEDKLNPEKEAEPELTGDAIESKAAEAEKVLSKATELSEVADESPIGDVITGILGIGSLVGGLFIHSHAHHFVAPPQPPQADTYSYQIGV